MSIMSSRLIRHEMCKDEIKNLGGRIIDTEGIMFLVKFVIDEYHIAYAYHINDDSTYHLERVKPYYLNIGIYRTEEDIIDAITVDIEQFKNAMNSSNFDKFIGVDHHLSQLVRLFEDLYLYYNINKEDLEALDSNVNGILDLIKNIMLHSTRVYTKKDPDILNENVKF